jgi:chaperonin cofactor prefoldin
MKKLALMAALAAALTTAAHAETVKFHRGQVLTASDLNRNFSALEKRLDRDDEQIATLRKQNAALRSALNDAPLRRVSFSKD